MAQFDNKQKASPFRNRKKNLLHQAVSGKNHVTRKKVTAQANKTISETTIRPGTILLRTNVGKILLLDSL